VWLLRVSLLLQLLLLLVHQQHRWQLLGLWLGLGD
jgi:hypothetical protein